MGNDVADYETVHSRKLCALPASTVPLGLLLIFYLASSFYHCRINLGVYNHLDMPIETQRMVTDVALKKSFYLS